MSTYSPAWPDQPAGPDQQVRRVARWRRALVAGTLTATLGVVGLVGVQATAAADEETPASVVTTTSSSTATGSTETGATGSAQSLSSGSASSNDATSSGS